MSCETKIYKSVSKVQTNQSKYKNNDNTLQTTKIHVKLNEVKENEKQIKHKRKYQDVRYHSQINILKKTMMHKNDIMEKTS